MTVGSEGKFNQKNHQKLNNIVFEVSSINQLVVVSMTTDPEPDQTVAFLHRKGSVVQPHTHGPESIDLF